ncbi:hypothetical protein [Bdellovibrio bacteriovorus]|uniref:hypothetical protein n=1 Tax=Bdellovibrio TaxID=958 RepID=UPI0035A97130
MALQIFTFFFATLLAAAAFGYPNVGNKVQWTGEVTHPDGTSVEVKIVKEVIAQDRKTKKWTVKFVATMGSETTTQIIEVDSLYSPERYKEIMANCILQGGKIEKITTPAGMYDTCKMTMVTADGSTVEKWWGDIPFGVVSKNTRDASTGEVKKPDLNSVVAGL